MDMQRKMTMQKLYVYQANLIEIKSPQRHQADASSDNYTVQIPIDTRGLQSVWIFKNISTRRPKEAAQIVSKAS